MVPSSYSAMCHVLCRTAPHLYQSVGLFLLRAVSWCYVPHHTVPCRAVSYRVVPCRAVPCRTLPCHTLTVVSGSPDEASPQLLRGSAHSLDGALRATFVPEYCVRAITEVYYLKIRRSHYVAARKATLVAAQRDPARSVDHSDSLAQDMANLVRRGGGRLRDG